MKLTDVVNRISGNVDRFTTDLEYYIGGEHFDSNELEVTKKGILKENLGKLGFKFHFAFQDRDVIFMARNPHLRKAGMVRFSGLCSDASYILRSKDESVITQDYLAILLQSDHFWNYCESHKVGSVNFANNWTSIANYEFELPSIKYQNEISKKVWAAYRLKKSYKKLLSATEEMVKSQFIEMFDINEDNHTRSSLVPFANCVSDMTKGPFGSDIKKSLYVPKSESAYKVYIQINAIEKNESLGDYYISKEYFDSKMHKFEVRPGDYIITCDGTLGKYIQIPDNAEKGIISASLLRLTLKDMMLPRYFEFLWDVYMLPTLLKEVRNTALKHLPSATKIGEMPIPLPNLLLQKRFSDIARQADKSGFELRKSIDAIDAVIKSLINN